MSKEKGFEIGADYEKQSNESLAGGGAAA